MARNQGGGLGMSLDGKKIVMIAVVAADRAIGRKGDLLWHLPGDLKHFRQLTMGCPVIMGRHTWESLPKRPLPGRQNIVVSRSPQFHPDGADMAGSPEEAVRIAAGPTVFVIGGGRIYEAMMPYADVLELTEVAAVTPDADTFFPEFNQEEWLLVSADNLSEKGFGYRFSTYLRNEGGAGK